MLLVRRRRRRRRPILAATLSSACNHVPCQVGQKPRCGNWRGLCSGPPVARSTFRGRGGLELGVPSSAARFREAGALCSDHATWWARRAPSIISHTAGVAWWASRRSVGLHPRGCVPVIVRYGHNRNVRIATCWRRDFVPTRGSGDVLGSDSARLKTADRFGVLGDIGAEDAARVYPSGRQLPVRLDADRARRWMAVWSCSIMSASAANRGLAALSLGAVIARCAAALGRIVAPRIGTDVNAAHRPPAEEFCDHRQRRADSCPIAALCRGARAADRLRRRATAAGQPARAR